MRHCGGTAHERYSVWRLRHRRRLHHRQLQRHDNGAVPPARGWREMPQAPYGSRRALSALPGCQPRLWPAHRRRVAQAARAEVLRLRHRRLLASGLHQRGRAGVRRRRPQRLRRGCVRHIQLQGNQRRARRRGRRRSPLHRVRCPEGQLESPRGFATAWRRETSRSTTSPSCAPKTGRSARRRRSCAGSTRRWGPSPPPGGRSCPCSNGTIRYRCSTATSCARCTRSESRSCNGARASCRYR